MAYGTINADVIQSSVSGVSLGAGNATVFKNRIINGNMTIDQRNAGASVTAAAGYTYCVDRWVLGASQASKFTAQQNAGSITPPVGFSNYLGATSSSAYTVGTSEQFWITQRIEGFNTADLQWGTANAKTVTMSFWAYSSLTGTFGGSIFNSAANYSYPFSYSIPVANTWTQISITIVGPTAGTWIGSTNGIGIQINFSLGAGATVSGTAGSWSANLYSSATGATSVVGTSGATFYITGVQLEVGSLATGFEYRDIGNQLAQCQRYFEMSYAQGTAVGTATQNNAVFAYINGISTNGASFSIKYSQVKRTSPTVTTYSTANTNTSGVMTSASNGTNYSTTITTSSDSSFGAFWAQASNYLNATMQWTASAEL